MKQVFKTYELNNGLAVKCFDLTRNYFGDFHYVIVEIFCEIPLTIDFLFDETLLLDARTLLGDVVTYKRKLEKFAVPSAIIADERDRLLRDFETHSLPYLEMDGFYKKFVSLEINRLKGKAVIPGSHAWEGYA